MKHKTPDTRVLIITLLTVIILTLIKGKTLCEIRFRDGPLEFIARMDCRSGK
ncbi:small toxic polypeptide [compost metagenome]|uniref:Hok/Gef family protein n=1 Tax=Lelliottia aquatilis TaxID=2080838 RepID=UPI000CDE6211|nr:Hok/Gef family protein [Lelliottia aquatilis]POZ14356.1 endonuclease [Lelliottia aquatilis]